MSESKKTITLDDKSSYAPYTGSNDEGLLDRELTDSEIEQMLVRLFQQKDEEE